MSRSNTIYIFITAIVLCMGVQSLQAQDMIDLTPKEPLERILNPDGTINMQSGVDGAVDPRGWRMTVDHYGRPRFIRNESAASQRVSSSKPEDERWDDRFGTPIASSGLDDEVFAVAVMGPYVFVGGAFTKAGEKELGRIGRWDGTKWSSLGDGGLNGVNGFVYALAVRDQILIVGGQFTTAGGTPSRNISQYNQGTHTWAPIGSGASGGGLRGDEQSFVGALAVVGSKLYAGGSFTKAGNIDVNNIAAWDFTTRQWSSVGGGVNGTVNALAAAGSNLYVGGNFSAAGSNPASSIARWDGTAWHQLGQGVDGFVNAIGVMAPGDTIIVGGSFSRAGDSTAHNVARWSGTTESWSPLTGVYQLWDSIAAVRDDDGADNVVRAIHVVGKTVYIGGTFQSVYPGRFTLNRLNANYIATWAELTESNIWWQPLGIGGQNGTDGFVNAIGSVGDDVYVGGAFITAGGVGASRIAKWNGSRWSALGINPSGTITTIGKMGEDIYAAGTFNVSSTGNPNATGVAKLSGSTWEPITGDVIGLVYSIVSHGKSLYIGGSFRTAGGQATNNIVRWNSEDETWSTLAGGLTADENPFVAAMTLNGDKLYVGGQFRQAGTVDAKNIAVWDIAAGEWSALGTGIDGYVLTLAATDNGDLYAGGRFLNADGLYTANIARWNGSAWSPLDSGANNAVLTMATRGDKVYIGGDFTRVGTISANHIAIWDGATNTWSPIGEGVGGHFAPFVSAMGFRGRDLYVGGYFTLADGDSASNIAGWDSFTGEWTTLGSGADGTVRSIVVTNDDIYVSGSFTRTGDKPSYYFGIWHELPSAVEREKLNASGLVLDQNYPNPAHRVTRFTFALPTSGHVTLTVTDARGLQIATIVDKSLPMGRHEISWDAADLPDGVYFYQIQSGSSRITKKLTLIR